MTAATEHFIAIVTGHCWSCGLFSFFFFNKSSEWNTGKLPVAILSVVAMPIIRLWPSSDWPGPVQMYVKAIMITPYKITVVQTSNVISCRGGGGVLEDFLLWSEMGSEQRYEMKCRQRCELRCKLRCEHRCELRYKQRCEQRCDGVIWDINQGVSWGVSRSMSWGMSTGVSWGVSRSVSWGMSTGVSWGVSRVVSQGVIWDIIIVSWGVVWGVSRSVSWGVSTGVSKSVSTGSGTSRGVSKGVMVWYEK